MLRDFAPLPVRALRVAERLEDVPRFIKQARANIKDPPRLYAEAAIDELQDAEKFFHESAIELGKEVPELSVQLAAAASSTKAFPATTSRSPSPTITHPSSAGSSSTRA
jgi:hypothetical protein